MSLPEHLGMPNQDKRQPTNHVTLFSHRQTLSLAGPPDCLVYRLRQIHACIPMQLILTIGVLVLASPVAAYDDTPTGCWAPITTALFLAGGYVVALSRTLVGPCMGITSALWFMMRNDAAVSPKLAWMVFAAWSGLALLYFVVQCHRVSNHRLYILLTIAVASACMGFVAVVQLSNLQSGLVTAIPPCTSFAACTVAYAFPKRRPADHWDIGA